MENCSNFIRVRVDLSDINIPFIKQAWASVDTAILRTIKDFKHTLYQKFNIPQEWSTSLYLKSYLLLDDETIFILRDEDLIKVVSNDSEVFLSPHCSNVVNITSSSAKNNIKCSSVNDSWDQSTPAAKKRRIHSPTSVLKSLDEAWMGNKTSVQSDSYLAESSNAPNETNADVGQNETGLKVKKQKKHKHSKVNTKNISDDLMETTSDFPENNVIHSEKLDGLNPHGNVKKQDEISGCIKVKKSKKRKVKEKESPENRIVDRISTSNAFANNSNSADGETNKHGSLASSVEGPEDCEMNVSNTSKNGVSGKRNVNKPFNENIIKLGERSDSHDSLENHSIVQKQGRKSNAALYYTKMELNQIVNEMFLQTEVKDTVRRHSPVQQANAQKSDSKSNSASHLENSDIFKNANNVSCDTEIKDPSVTLLSEVLPASLTNLPLKVDGDCTQSLGNNCPKKKRRRRRRKVAKNSSCSPDDTTTTTNSVIIPPFQTGKLISDLAYNENKQYTRKHIKFSDSPERELAVEILDSKCSDDKEVPTFINSSQSAQMLVKEKNTPCRTDNFAECASNTLFHQTAEPSVQTSNEVNQNKSVALIEKNYLSQEHGPKSYSDFPPLNKFPSVGDVIAYKVLELTDEYCPEVSDYKEGEIVYIDMSTDKLEINLLEEQVIAVRTGKFENIYPDEELQPQVIKKVSVFWTDLIEPKLISSSSSKTE